MKLSPLTSLHKDPRFQKLGLYFGLVLALGFNLSWNPELVNIVRNERLQYSELALASVSPELKALQDKEEALTAKLKTAEAELATGEKTPERISAVEKIRTELREVKQKIAAQAQEDASTRISVQPAAGSATAASSELSDDGSTKIIDLEKEDSRIKMRLRVTKAGDTLFIQPEKKKSDTEGTTENCDACKLSERRGQSNVNLNNIGDLRGIALRFMKDNQDTLVKQTEQDKKSKDSDSDVASIDKNAKGKGQFVEKCRKLDDDEIMDCQLEALIEKRDSCSKYDASCKSQISALWKPIQKHLKECMQGRARTNSALRRDSSFDPDDFDRDMDDDNCADAKDVALQAIEGIKDNKIRTQTIKLLQYSVRETIKSEQLYARSKKMSNAEASVRLVGMLDSTSRQMGSQILSSLYNSENYSSNPEYYMRMYDSNFATPLWSARDGLLNNPLSYEFGALNVESTAPSNIAQYRQRATTGSVPQPPPIARADGSNSSFSANNLNRSSAIPTNNSNFRPQQQQQLPTSGQLLSPAQRAGRY